MIKNSKQAALTKERLARLQKDLKEFMITSNPHSLEYELGTDSFMCMIKELEDQLLDYEYLKNGNFHCFDGKSFEDLPRVLISARLAQGLSQKDLALKLGIQEQQIQRYESTNYESASYPRLLDIAEALNIELSFSRVIIVGNGPSFITPPNITEESITEAEKAAKLNGSLVI